MLQDLAVRIDNMHKDFSPHKISLEVANHLLLSLWKGKRFNLYIIKLDFLLSNSSRWCAGSWPAAIQYLQ